MLYTAILVGCLILGSDAQVGLGTAAPFSVLAATTITNTGLTTVAGELGLFPGTSITGFPPGISGDQHTADAVAKQAQADATTAYNQAAGLASTQALTGQDLGGMTLGPGVYTFTSSAGLTGALTLDAKGDSNAQFVFQIGSTLTTASASSVLLVNGANACNVIWQIGSSATLGTGTTFAGVIIANTAITVTTGCSVNGALYALNAAVTLDTDQITQCQGSNNPAPTSATASTTGKATPTTASAGTTTITSTVTVTATGSPSTVTITNTGTITSTKTVATSYTTCTSTKTSTSTKSYTTKAPTPKCTKAKRDADAKKTTTVYTTVTSTKKGSGGSPKTVTHGGGKTKTVSTTCTSTSTHWNTTTKTTSVTHTSTPACTTKQAAVRRYERY